MAGYPSEPQNFIPPLEKNDLFQNNPPFGKVINIMYWFLNENGRNSLLGPGEEYIDKQ